MLKTIVVGAATLVLAGGAFMTAQALTPDGQGLPTVKAPLTVQPASTRTTATTSALTTRTATTTGPATTGPTTTWPACRGEDDRADGRDRHGSGSDDAYESRCHHLHTVIPTPSVLTDDHGRHAEPGDDHGGHGEAEPGDDHGAHGEAEPGDDHGGSSDDHGGQR